MTSTTARTGWLDYAALRRHCASRAAPVLAFGWGLAEATLFFIVPDVYIGFVALFHWRRAALVVAAALAGALIGGALMYWLGARDAALANDLLVRVPGIGPSMVAEVAGQVARGGLGPMIGGAFRGFPYKIYAVQAGAQGLPFLAFLALSLPARLNRFAGVAVVAGALGAWLRPRVERRPALAAGLYALAWAVEYVVYYLSLAED